MIPRYPFFTACMILLPSCSYVNVSKTSEYQEYIGKSIPTSKDYWVFCKTHKENSEHASLSFPKESPWGTCLLSEIYPGAESSKWHPRAKIKRGTPIRVLFITASAGLGGAPGAHRAFGEVKISSGKKIKVLRHRSEGKLPLW